MTGSCSLLSVTPVDIGENEPCSSTTNEAEARPIEYRADQQCRTVKPMRRGIRVFECREA
jgi:hypothetical protein